MREIKFRAWDGKVMHYNVSYIPSWGAIKHGYAGTAWTHEARAGEIMQFTGLHDRNGKEIYEGDLIKVVGAESGEMVVHVDDITMMPLSTLYPAGEVIGNICENPNLVGG